jgi:tricarballylate dehydrogenase
VPARRIPAAGDGFPGDQAFDIVKSNWARPISAPPFYAYPIISGVCFTYGGVKTNSNGQTPRVLLADWGPLEFEIAPGSITALGPPPEPLVRER